MRLLLRFIIPFIFTCSSVSAQFYFNENDTMYSWAYSGLNIRESEDKMSPIMATIPFGSMIIIDSIPRTDVFDVEVIEPIRRKYKLTSSYSLKGKMIRIKYDSITGYVFSGLLGYFEPFDKKIHFIGLDKQLDESYGVSQSIDWSEDMVIKRQVVYNNGVIYKLQAQTGWFQDTFIFTNSHFQEGVLLLQAILRSEAEYSGNLNWYIAKKEDKLIELLESTDMYKVILREVDDFFVLTHIGSN